MHGRTRTTALSPGMLEARSQPCIAVLPSPAEPTPHADRPLMPLPALLAGGAKAPRRRKFAWTPHWGACGLPGAKLAGGPP